VVQVDPIKPKLKPPGTECLKLKCDIMLSTSALKFNLRRYIMDFVAASLTKVRFWVILCPINLVGKARDSVGDMVGRWKLAL